MLKPDITAFFDPATSTYSYVVRDPSSRACAIVDPVLDYDPAAGRTSHASAERLIAHVRQHDLQVEWLLETHVHADHLSAAIFLQRELGGCLAIGARITQVQAKFSGLFNLGEAFPVDGRQFEHLFEDGESFRIGALECRALPTPSKAQLARHGSETRKNSNASRPIRPACPAPSPANSASAARAIIQALGLTSCNAAPPSTPRRRGGSAPSMPPALRNRLQAR